MEVMDPVVFEKAVRKRGRAQLQFVKPRSRKEIVISHDHSQEQDSIYPGRGGMGHIVSREWSAAGGRLPYGRIWTRRMQILSVLRYSLSGIFGNMFWGGEEYGNYSARKVKI